MNRQAQPSKKAFRSFRQIVIKLILVLVGLILITVLIVWVLWPVRQTSLQKAPVKNYTFASAKSQVKKINQQEKANGVKSSCYSSLKSHPRPTEKTVVMFHGVSACPAQFSLLADHFYDRGYNVYIPLAPEHGREDKQTHANVTSQGLVDYANQSVNIASGLGEEVGVIGLSGGGNLATWASQYRPDVRRFVALSPFYEPDAAQAPKWQIRPLLVLHGNNIIPDQQSNPEDLQNSLSYRALAKYITIFKNLPSPAKNTNLKQVALVMADDDDQIDQALALKTLGKIAVANALPLDRYQLPASLKLGHDIVHPDNLAVAENIDFLYQKYFELYER